MLKNEAVTWDTLAALARQNLLFTRGNADSARLIATGERVLSPMVSSQNVVSAREKGPAHRLLRAGGGRDPGRAGGRPAQGRS
ncbi:hypothetical protein ACFS3C_10660 [Azotobacter vinelandii]